MSANSHTLEPIDPGEIKDYAVDWVNVLAKEGEIGIGTSSWTASYPPGLTVLSSEIVGKKAVVWVTGANASPNTLYTLENAMVTVSGTPRTHRRSIHILCQHR